MSFAKYLILVSTITVFFFIACKDEKFECSTADLTTVVDTNWDKVTQASLAYVGDKSQENCEAYKQSYNDFETELSQFQDCTLNMDDEVKYNETLEKIQEDLSNIPC